MLPSPSTSSSSSPPPVLRLGTPPLTPLPSNAILLSSDGPDKIILRDADHERLFQSVTVQMRQALEDTRRDMKWTPDYYWAVRYRDMWYRASYVHKRSQVLLMDTMEMVDVSKDKWRKLPKELHPDVVPPLAVRAHLGGLVPAQGGEWCFEALQYLTNLQGSQFEMIPMRRNPVCLPKGEKSYQVDLMVPCIVCDGPFKPARRKKRPLSSELHKRGWARMKDETQAELGWINSLDKTPPMSMSPPLSSPFESLNGSLESQTQNQMDSDCDQLEGRTNRWQPVPFPPSKFSGVVTNVVDGLIVAHRADQVKELNRLRAELAAIYGEGLDDVQTRTWTVGDATVFKCVVRGKKEYMRGIITRLDGLTSFVLSVDFGIAARVPINELRVAYDEPSVPPFGIWIIVEDVRPPGGGGRKWSDEALQFLKETVNFKRNGPIEVSLIPEQTSEFPLLARVTNGSGEDVARILQDRGHGVFGEPFLFECDEEFYKRIVWGIEVDKKQD